MYLWNFRSYFFCYFFIFSTPQQNSPSPLYNGWSAVFSKQQYISVILLSCFCKFPHYCVILYDGLRSPSMMRTFSQPGLSHRCFLVHLSSKALCSSSRFARIVPSKLPSMILCQFSMSSAGHIPGKQRGRMHHKNVSKKFCNNGENVAKRDHIQRLNIKNDQKPQLLLTTSSRNWFRFVYCKSILKMILAILWNILFSYPLSGHFKSSLQSWGWKLSVIQSVELFCKILEAGLT